MQTLPSRLAWHLLPKGNVLASASALINSANPHASSLLQHAGTAANCRSFSVQHEEEIRVRNPSRSQKADSPPITPDTSTGAPAGQHTSDGRSSQTTSTQVLLLGLLTVLGRAPTNQSVLQIYCSTADTSSCAQIWLSGAVQPHRAAR